MASTEEGGHHIKDPSFLFHEFIIKERQVPTAAKTLSRGIVSKTKLPFPHKEQYNSNLRVIHSQMVKNEIQKTSYINGELQPAYNIFQEFFL